MDLCFTADVFFLFLFLFQPEISELRRPIAAKLCHVIRRFFRFIIYNFEIFLNVFYIYGEFRLIAKTVSIVCKVLLFHIFNNDLFFIIYISQWLD